MTRRSHQWPALEAWRAELRRGLRTSTTYDPLWRSACAELTAPVGSEADRAASDPGGIVTSSENLQQVGAAQDTSANGRDGPKAVRAILDQAFGGLMEGPSVAELELALRNLQSEIAGTDSITRQLVRTSAVIDLKELGV
jgi:hypothetical protein